MTNRGVLYVQGGFGPQHHGTTNIPNEMWVVKRLDIGPLGKLTMVL
jgi:hypothetical protein